MTFVFDESLVGRATITVGRPVAPDEALAILDSLLLSRGFAVLQAGAGARKIMPIGEASAGAPLASDEGAGGSSLVTTMIGLESIKADIIAAKLQHLVAQSRAVLAYPPSNSLILVATEAELQRLIELARAMDAVEPEELVVRTLRHRASDAVVEIASEVLQPHPGEATIELWSDARTNSILALGTSDQLERTRAFLSELDVTEVTGSPIGVIPILNRDAVETAEMLRAVGGASAGQRGVPGGPGGVAAGPRAAARRPSGAVGDVLAGRSFTIVADEGTNTLLVDADPETLAALRDVIEELDREQPQVLVEIVALEISSPTSLALGIDWFLPAFDPNGKLDKVATFISNPSGGGLRAEAGENASFFGRISRNPLVIPIVNAQNVPIDVVIPRETLVITADEREVDTRVLLRPRLVMVPGETNELFVGDNIPVPVGSPNTAAAVAGLQTNVQIQRQDVGVVLRVEPTLGQAGKVQLKLDIETSRVGAPIAGSVELVGPTLEKRSVSTKVLLGDGELAILGTTQQNAVEKTLTTTPFLGDIPFFGRFMESKRKISMDLHVVFAVQARILRTPAETLAESIRERLAYQRSFERVRDLERVEGAPYALLVDTFRTRARADALGKELEALGMALQVGRWRDDVGELYDVYATGYRGLVDAGEASRALLAQGFDSQIVVLPLVSSFAQQGSAGSAGYPLR